MLSQAQFLGPSAAFPPPFRWIFHLAQLVYKAKKKTRQDTKQHEKTSVRMNKKKYFFCLKELILVKQQKDKDNTMDENFSIFKNDLLEQFGRFLNDPDNDEN